MRQQQSPKIVIKNFRMEDYDSVIALWKKAGLPYKPKGRDKREIIAVELKRGKSIFLVARVNGAVIGSVLGTHDGRKGWINRVAVDPDFQRQGIARQLVAEAEKRLHALGIGIIACLIEDWNTVSMAAFERLGYRKQPGIFYFSKKSRKDV
jgi:ribosomal protein S18 acetylase RimI-like enzyme